MQYHARVKYLNNQKNGSDNGYLNIQHNKSYNMKEFYDEVIYISNKIYNKEFSRQGRFSLKEKSFFATVVVLLYNNYEEFSWHGHLSLIQKQGSYSQLV